MHFIEPYYNWRGYYIASEDPSSPFYERVYSEFEYSNRIYNFLIHPQWDYFGSPTLFVKVLQLGTEAEFLDCTSVFHCFEQMCAYSETHQHVPYLLAPSTAACVSFSSFGLCGRMCLCVDRMLGVLEFLMKRCQV